MSEMQKRDKMVGLLKILNALDNGEVVLKDLESEMNLSLRTIQRYIRAIEDADFPLYSPSPGIYSFVEGFSLQKMKLSDKEACLLVLMDNFVGSINNKNLAEAFKELKTRILNSNADNPFYIKTADSVSYESNDITKALETAVTNKEIINMKYKNPSDDIVRWINNIKPVKIAYYDGFWYLIALGNQNKILKFRVTYITDVRLSGENFKYDKKIEALLKESKNIWFDEERDTEVNLLLDKRLGKYFKDKEYFPLQKIETENPDGSFIVSCKISKFEEIMPLIFHWIPFIKVISPKELAETVKGKVKNYLEEL
ncbi:MAG: WYL domain-containing protein [Endomicrobia bacterium]|nr:WYL domain-containing protein [Endomicrobiia bacterium]MCL2507209.1 WYL domain-containing protein [Endomicrobiia bacterium]